MRGTEDGTRKLLWLASKLAAQFRREGLPLEALLMASVLMARLRVVPRDHFLRAAGQAWDRYNRAPGVEGVVS